MITGGTGNLNGTGGSVTIGGITINHGLTRRQLTMTIGTTVAVAAVATMSVIALKRRRLRQRREDAQQKVEEFKLKGSLIGRDSLITDMIIWIINEKNQRLFVTLGCAGSGKSALSVGLARVLREGYQSNKAIIDGGSGSSGDRIRLLHHYICMHSNVNDDIQRQSFLDSISRSCNDANLAIGDGPFNDLTSLFIALQSSTPHHNTMYVILIDGLDESRSILSLLDDDTIGIMPKWMKLLVTTRPIAGRDWSHSSFIHPFDLITSPSQRLAVKEYIGTRFPPILHSRGINDEATIIMLRDALVKHTDLIFIYARLIMEAIESKQMEPTLTAITSLPSDLDTYYHRSFRHYWPLTSSGLAPPSYAIVRDVLEVISAVKIRDQTIQSLIIDDRYTAEDVQGAINMLSPFIQFDTFHLYFDHNQRTVSCVHKSINDWLVSDTPYRIDPIRGHARYIISAFLHSSPIDWELKSVPSLHTFIKEWLGVNGSNGLTMKRDGDHEFSLRSPIPTELKSLVFACKSSKQCQLISILERERHDMKREDDDGGTSSGSVGGGNGFWSNKDMDWVVSRMVFDRPTTKHHPTQHSDAIFRWITMAPERAIFPRFREVSVAPILL
jgi:hypothetical protein